jgi:hypothetical protein
LDLFLRGEKRNQTKCKLPHALKIKRKHNLKACHGRKKFWKGLVERREGEGVEKKREGRENCFPNLERENDRDNENILTKNI